MGGFGSSSEPYEFLCSQESIDSLINEAKKHPIKHKVFQVLYGISQNPDTGDYILVQNNYMWTSENEKIDDFIQERQYKINKYDDIVLEWIPYNQFSEIKEIESIDSLINETKKYPTNYEVFQWK
ncbi:kinase-like domain-containing protein [Rhizophagus irregularis DAOM 181602=DAOM 197198]|nr:kinase-like domain-containing protein [Rhizophagus irregularis DAOM 181602=DAOM 197198]